MGLLLSEEGRGTVCLLQEAAEGTAQASREHQLPTPAGLATQSKLASLVQPEPSILLPRGKQGSHPPRQQNTRQGRDPSASTTLHRPQGEMAGWTQKGTEMLRAWNDSTGIKRSEGAESTAQG